MNWKPLTQQRTIISGTIFLMSPSRFLHLFNIASGQRSMTFDHQRMIGNENEWDRWYVTTHCHDTRMVCANVHVIACASILIKIELLKLEHYNCVIHPCVPFLFGHLINLWFSFYLFVYAFRIHLAMYAFLIDLAILFIYSFINFLLVLNHLFYMYIYFFIFSHFIHLSIPFLCLVILFIYPFHFYA